MVDPNYVQEYLPGNDFLPTEQETSTPKITKDCTNGSRISPSQIETLSYLYDKYKDETDESTLLEEVLAEKTFEREKTLENAHWSIYGTQMHSLMYFNLLFTRAQNLNRYPTYKDFETTFPYRDKSYYDGLAHILELTDLQSSNPAQSFWNEWKMNGHDFTPQRHKNYLLCPSQIQNMWENGTVPLKDIHQLNRHFQDVDRQKVDPNETLVMHEISSITNMYCFDGTNMQVPTTIDEICIPKDYPNSPIQIIDYKTGDEFKQPQYKEKIQIFLMMTATLVHILDRVTKIQYLPSDWDIAHNTREFPFFKERRPPKNTLIGAIYFEHLQGYTQEFTNSFQFSYINPLTQDRIDVSTKDIGLDTPKGFKDMLMYLDSINHFYTRNKDILKNKIDSKKTYYTLPTFPSENFCNGCSKDVQLNLI